MSYKYVPTIKQLGSILNLAHTNIYAGHCGINKTFERVKSRFYKPGLYTMIYYYVKCCDSCKKVKITQPKRKAELQPIESTQPNELWTSDIAGPFDDTERKNRYILLIVDHFSKRVGVIALQNLAAKSLADCLLYIIEEFCNFGIPLKILTDNGTNYMSQLLEIVFDYIGPEKISTTIYNPLSCYVDENVADWDLKLKKLQLADNTAEHASTK
jgi:hypothetical protein